MQLRRALRRPSRPFLLLCVALITATSSIVLAGTATAATPSPAPATQAVQANPGGRHGLPLSASVPAPATASGPVGISAAALGPAERPALVASDSALEVVWNIGPGATPAGYQVTLYQAGCTEGACTPASAGLPASSQVATQTVCGTCSWATFSGSSVVNGSRYWARVEPLAAASPAQGAVSGLATPAVLPSANAPTAGQLALEDEAFQVAGLLKSTDPDHAGVAIDLAAGKVVRGLVDNTDFTRQAATVNQTTDPGLVVTRPMAYSTQTLMTLADTIAKDRATLAGEGIHLRETAVETLEGKVRVSVDGPVTPAMVATLGARYGTDKIVVDARGVARRPAHNLAQNSAAPRVPPAGTNFAIYGGIEIQDNNLLDGSCTAGYLTKKSDNNIYLLTAGHCFPNGATVSVPNADILAGTTNTVIGTVVNQASGFNTNGDYEAIQLTFNDLATNQILATSTLLRNVTDDADAFVSGTRVCVNGFATNEERCAYNDAIGDAVFDDHTTFHTADAFETDVATNHWVDEGDSGSGVYRSLSSSSFRIYGVVDGPAWNFDDNDTLQSPTDGGFYYTLDQDIQDTIGTSVLTSPVS